MSDYDEQVKTLEAIEQQTPGRNVSVPVTELLDVTRKASERDKAVLGLRIVTKRFDALAGENDRLWRFLADEAPIRELPEWMRDKIYARERAEQEAMASDE